MLAVRIPDEMESRLDKLATLTGRPKSFYVREALQAHLDDIRTPTPPCTGWNALPDAGRQRIRRRALTTKSDPEWVKAWTVEFDDRARRELRKLAPETQEWILRSMRERVAGSPDPRQFGKPLRMKLAGLWRYRVGDYRVVCRLEDNRLVVFVIKVGHRREV
jgi:mRNA interferase RelE/StbE